MKEFQDRVDFSTIILVLNQGSQVRKAVRTDVEAVFRDNGPGFFTRLGESLRVGWQWALDLVVALARLWPLWLIVAAAISLVRYLRRRKAPAP